MTNSREKVRMLVTLTLKQFHSRCTVDLLRVNFFILFLLLELLSDIYYYWRFTLLVSYHASAIWLCRSLCFRTTICYR